MSILTKYTLRCLRQNRVRTLVTVIGIVLSVALFTAVSEGAYSGQQYLLNVTKASIGNFHGQYRELSDSLSPTTADMSLSRSEKALTTTIRSPLRQLSTLRIVPEPPPSHIGSSASQRR